MSATGWAHVRICLCVCERCTCIIVEVSFVMLCCKAALCATWFCVASNACSAGQHATESAVHAGPKTPRGVVIGNHANEIRRIIELQDDQCGRVPSVESGSKLMTQRPSGRDSHCVVIGNEIKQSLEAFCSPDNS